MDREIYISQKELISRRDDGRWKYFPSALARQLSINQPIALLFRQIATPSFEMFSFIRKSRRLGLEPVVIQHRHDNFSVHNSYKRSLAIMPIALGKNRHKEIVWRRQKLLLLDDIESQKLNSIILPSGESLVGYHNRHLYGAFGSYAPRIVDLSEIIPSAQCGAKVYYRDLLCLLTGNVVLFEDFVVDGQTSLFFSSTVLPAYESASKIMCGRPQIARLAFGRRASSPIWNYYPVSILDDVQKASEGAYHAASG